MKIDFKTGGTLVRFLPNGSKGNKAAIQVPDGSTPIDVIKQLGMPADGSYLVIHNGSSVPRAERAELTLSDGDSLAIMPPLKGG